MKKEEKYDYSWKFTYRWKKNMVTLVRNLHEEGRKTWSLSHKIYAKEEEKQDYVLLYKIHMKKKILLIHVQNLCKERRKNMSPYLLTLEHMNTEENEEKAP